MHAQNTPGAVSPAERYDIVIAGAGAAGAPLAARLSEDPDLRVLLIDAGPDFPEEAEHPPAFFIGGQTYGEGLAGVGAPVPELDWGYKVQPLANGRVVDQHRGKLVGGSTMINGCVFVRGNPRDFDEDWARSGGEVWNWDGVRPYYEKVKETVPIHMTRPDRLLPLQRLFLEAWQELGHEWVDDVNDPEAWGNVVGIYPHNRRNEVRQGTLVTYLREARGRPNLTIEGRLLVDRVLFSGTEARGLRVIDADGEPREIEAGTVVLSSGTFGTPAILMRSGIGRADVLAHAGVEQLLDLPVGEAILDHPQAWVNLSAPPELTRLDGPQHTAIARGHGWWTFPMSVDEIAGAGIMLMGITDVLPKGQVTINGADPAEAPVIEQGYDELIRSGTFDRIWEEHLPLGETAAFKENGITIDETQSLEEILYERLGSAQHPTGGAAIGSVVDAELAVEGTTGLFVVDASVFPAHVENNPNYTCMMIGEKAVDLVRPHLR